MMRAVFRARCPTETARSVRLCHQAELSGAIEEVFDRRGRPAIAAARRAFIHGLQLRADLFERQFWIGPGDAGDERQQPVARRLAVGGPEQRWVGEPLGDEALELLDRPAQRGGGVGLTLTVRSRWFRGHN